MICTKNRIVVCSAAVPLALVCCLNVGSVAGSALTKNISATSDENTVAAGNVVVVNKDNAVLSEKSGVVQNKSSGDGNVSKNVSAAKEEKNDESTSALSAEDKDKIIKVLLERMGNGHSVVETQANLKGTVSNKEKVKGIAADILQKLGNIGSFVYAIYGACGLIKGDTNVKDVATATTALLSVANLGSQAIRSF